MDTAMDVKEIESAITQLSPSELAKLAKWFEEFQAQFWDRQLEQDVEAGRFDTLLEEVDREFDSRQRDLL